jgi:nucleotide-binding universal stress UspA family protein
MKFTNILFPVDFSERCRAVAPFVSAMAKRDGASVTVLHVVEHPVMRYGAVETTCVPDLDLARLIAAAEHRLIFFADEWFVSGIKTNTCVESGNPAACIIDVTRCSGADLIMMPTRGHGRFRAALLGSVTSTILHDAACPVWTAAHCDEPGSGYSDQWRKIVCAVDTTDEALRLIRCARDLSASNGASIHLVHAVPAAPESGLEKYVDREFEVFLKDSARNAIGAMQAKAGTDFQLCVQQGKISAVVAAVAEHDEADLVLIGRGVLPRAAGGFRTHVYAIIRDAPCPVLSI